MHSFRRLAIATASLVALVRRGISGLAQVTPEREPSLVDPALGVRAVVSGFEPSRLRWPSCRPTISSSSKRQRDSETRRFRRACTSIVLDLAVNSALRARAAEHRPASGLPSQSQRLPVLDSKAPPAWTPRTWRRCHCWVIGSTGSSGPGARSSFDRNIIQHALPSRTTRRTAVPFPRRRHGTIRTAQQQGRGQARTKGQAQRQEQAKQGRPPSCSSPWATRAAVATCRTIFTGPGAGRPFGGPGRTTPTCEVWCCGSTTMAARRPDNPFFAVGSGIPGQFRANVQKLFAYGIRNSFGMDFETRDGRPLDGGERRRRFTESPPLPATTAAGSR